MASLAFNESYENVDLRDGIDLPLENLAQQLSMTLISLRALERKQDKQVGSCAQGASNDHEHDERVRVIQNQLRVVDSALKAATAACSRAQEVAQADAESLATEVEPGSLGRRGSTICVPIHSEKCCQLVNSAGEHKGMTCTCSPLFNDVLEANVRASLNYKLASTNIARLGLAVVTCIDSRIDFQTIFGLKPGDAKFFRNAGARVTDDVVRGLAAACAVLGVTRIALVGHTGCKMAACTQKEVEEAVVAAGGNADAAAAINFLTMEDQVSTLREDVERLRECKALRPGVVVAGFILDMESGLLRVVDNGDVASQQPEGGGTGILGTVREQQCC